MDLSRGEKDKCTRENIIIINNNNNNKRVQKKAPCHINTTLSTIRPQHCVHSHVLISHLQFY